MQRAAKRARLPARTYIFIYVLAATLAAFRPALAEDRLTIPFAPEIGVERHYEILRSRQRSDGRRLERILEARSRAVLTPLSRNPDGYLYRFVITETEATAPGSTKPGLERLLSRLAALTTGVALVYQADALGAPRRLVNAREVRQALRGMLSELQVLVRSLTQAGVISQVERPNIEANVRNILGNLATLSDEELSRNVLKEAGLLFAAGGHELPLGRLEPFTPTPSPGPSGTTEFMAAEGRRGITSLLEAERQAVVEIRIAYERSELGAAVAQLVERLVESNGRNRNAATPSADSFRVTESSRYLVDLRNGQPIALRHRRTMAFSERRLVEVTRIGRIRP